MIKFLLPVKTDFGRGAFLKNHSRLDKKNTLVLISKSAYFADKTKFNFENASIEIIQSLCSITMIDSLYSKYQNQNIEKIVGIGGGSILDISKSLRGMFSTNESSINYLVENLDNVTKLRDVELYLIPTTAGTGSESSKAAIILDEQNGIRFGLRGELAIANEAIIDPELIQACNLKTKMESGFDVFAHGVETYISKKSNTFTRNESLFIIKSIVKYLPRYLENSNDEEAVDNVMLASYLAGPNLFNSGTCLPHRIQYAISSQKDVSHGLGLRLIYPSWIKQTKNKHKCFEEIANSLGFENFDILFEEFCNKINFNPQLPYKLKNILPNKVVDLVEGDVESDPGYTELNLNNIIKETFI